MLAWAEEYDGVYQMEIVGRKYLVVTDPALVPPIVGRGSPGLPKSDGYAMWDAAISPHAGVQGLFTVADNTPTWRAVRRAYGPALGPGSLSFHYPIVLSCAAKLGDWLAAAGGRGCLPLELNAAAKALTLDMLGLSAFGIDFRCLDDPTGAQLPHLIERAMLECGERGRGVGRRLLPWLFERRRREGEAAMAGFHALVRDIWARIKARGPPGEGDCSMGAQLMRLADPARGSEALSNEQICAEIATVIIAGYETTANTLTWMLFGLHAYPEASQRLMEELREAGLAPPDDAQLAPSGATATDAAYAAAATDADAAAALGAAFRSLPGGHEGLAALPYLDAYVRECLRLYSTAPNGLIKAVPAGGPAARIGPFAADPGVVVWVPFWGLHLSRRNWERPLAFEPERWIGADPRSAGAISASRCPVSAAAGALRAMTSAASGGAAITASANAAPAASAASTATALLDRSTAPASPSTTPGATETSSDSDSQGGMAPKPGSAPSAASASAAAITKAIRYMPFGDGSRNCIGQHLAMLQLKVVVSYLASRFRFRLDEQAMGGVEGALDRQRVNLTLEVDGGMWMYAEPRRAQQARTSTCGTTEGGRTQELVKPRLCLHTNRAASCIAAGAAGFGPALRHC